MKTRTIDAWGVALKVGTQFVCWNSFKGAWYLGRKKESEIFGVFSKIDPHVSRLLSAMQEYPSAKQVYVY